VAAGVSIELNRNRLPLIRFGTGWGRFRVSAAFGQPLVLTNMETILNASPTNLGMGMALICASMIYIFGRNKNRNYPPGPPREFLIGSLRYFPQNNFWVHFRDWAHEYGP
jgi:hypothetical protein